ncbi:unnamed protein product [Clavelina lepadiformis]|uniref:Uncharacterized protein n=1 Tax=Clavelina lepadiformis TaxID=159417 RepID=A0ABP0FXP1_CLALP
MAGRQSPADNSDAFKLESLILGTKSVFNNSSILITPRNADAKDKSDILFGPMLIMTTDEFLAATQCLFQSHKTVKKDASTMTIAVETCDVGASTTEVDCQCCRSIAELETYTKDKQVQTESIEGSDPGDRKTSGPNASQPTASHERDKNDTSCNSADIVTDELPYIKEEISKVLDKQTTDCEKAEGTMKSYIDDVAENNSKEKQEITIRQASSESCLDDVSKVLRSVPTHIRCLYLSRCILRYAWGKTSLTRLSPLEYLYTYLNLLYDFTNTVASGRLNYVNDLTRKYLGHIRSLILDFIGGHGQRNRRIDVILFDLEVLKAVRRLNNWDFEQAAEQVRRRQAQLDGTHPEAFSNQTFEESFEYNSYGDASADYDNPGGNSTSTELQEPGSHSLTMTEDFIAVNQEGQHFRKTSELKSDRRPQKRFTQPLMGKPCKKRKFGNGRSPSAGFQNSRVNRNVQNGHKTNNKRGDQYNNHPYSLNNGRYRNGGNNNNN